MDSELIEAIKQLPPKQQTTAIAINHYLTKWQESEIQAQKKIHQLQTEYLRSVLPLQKEINAIIKGIRAPTEEEIKEADAYAIENKQSQASPLQHYWGQVLINNSLTGKLLSESDKDILKYLLSVEAELGENGKDFTLKFEFADNEYFDACTLTKEYKFEDEEDEQPSVLKGSQINWKAGKNITKKIVKKQQKNKKTGQVREIQKEEKAPTFFHFFEDVEVIQDECEKEERKQFDYELGSQFINQVIPNALGNYLGLKIEGEEEDLGEYSGEEEEDDESLEDD